MSAPSGSRPGKTPASPSFLAKSSRMPDSPFPERLLSLPKTELHLHLEGSMRPAIVSALTARHGVPVSEEEVHRRYSYTDFLGFLDAFKWVTSFLRTPDDYALIAQDLAEQLLLQNVVYAEVTLSVGVMLLRNQRPEKNSKRSSAPPNHSNPTASNFSGSSTPSANSAPTQRSKSSMRCAMLPQKNRRFRYRRR